MRGVQGPDNVGVRPDQGDRCRRVADDVGDAGHAGRVVAATLAVQGPDRGAGPGDVEVAVQSHGDGDRQAIVQGPTADGRQGEVQVRSRGLGVGDRGLGGRGIDLGRQPGPQSFAQHRGHDSQPGIVPVPEHVADLVHQDGEQIHASEGRAVGRCCGAGIGQGLSELGTVRGGGVDEPAAPCGGRIEGDQIVVRLAQLAGREIGDLDLEIGQAAGEVLGQSGVGPEPDGLFQNRGEGFVGERLRIGRRSGLDIVESVRKQRVFSVNEPPFIPLGRVGWAQVVVNQGIRRKEGGRDLARDRRSARQLGVGHSAAQRVVAARDDGLGIVLAEGQLGVRGGRSGLLQNRRFGLFLVLGGNRRFGGLGLVGQVPDRVLGRILEGTHLPTFGPVHGGPGIGCCNAAIRPVRGRDFGARSSVDFLHDDGEFGARVLPFVFEKGPVDLAENRVGRKQDPGLQGLEQELSFRGPPSVVRRARAIRDLGCARFPPFPSLKPTQQANPLAPSRSIREAALIFHGVRHAAVNLATQRAEISARASSPPPTPQNPFGQPLRTARKARA